MYVYSMGLLHRRTPTTIAVLKYLVERPEGTWGLEIARNCGLKPATVYLLLDRLAERNIVTAVWEESGRSGPRRKLYRLVNNRVQDVLAEISASEHISPTRKAAIQTKKLA